MSILSIIMGDSGTGKSTSLRNLDPADTYIINVLNKPLPFRGYKNSYVKKEGGNYYNTDNSALIIKIMKTISEKRPEIKNIIIDDFHYIMANQYMRRAKEKGFERFTDIAQDAWYILDLAPNLRDDLYVFVLTHTEADKEGKIRFKTVGKLIDSMIVFEGMVTCIFHSMVIENKYVFLTQNDGVHIARSPMGLFESIFIENDLLDIKNKMENYFKSNSVPINDMNIVKHLGPTIHPRELSPVDESDIKTY